MIIHSDWHIHSEYSYDATNTLEGIAAAAKEEGLRLIGITDHANYNDTSFLGNIRDSAAGVAEAQKTHPNIILGVEFTPIAKPQFDYIAKTGTKEGFVWPEGGTPFPIELALSKEEMMALGIRYAIGASHWRVDVPTEQRKSDVPEDYINEWYRQQMWLACDERVTILGHPWYHGKGLWYEDFDMIPRSMKMDIAAALKENGKYVECNSHFLRNKMGSEKFRHQYAEYMREMFEMGIPVTYGSDSHHNYFDARPDVEKYLVEAGFKDGDIAEIAEKDLW